MPSLLSAFKRVDPLILLILAAVAVAIVAPARGGFAEVFSGAVKVAIALLFFLYGARLSTAEALSGLRHWRLHATITAFTFIVYPLVGLALHPLSAVVGEETYLGILYMTLVPSTVQSSVAFTSIAGGNVAGAIVAASLSNLGGVFATPTLVTLLMGTGTGVHIDGSVFGEIALLLLAPFVAGQLLRRWVGSFAASKGTKIVDRGSITMVVYSAFSAGVVGGIWQQITLWQTVFLIAFSVALVAFMLWLTQWAARRCGFSDADSRAIQFCGTKKSLATGLPMATVIFGTTGAQLALLVLPLMIFHQVQLMICAWLASRYARQQHRH